ncbi:MAG TPA: hypothetical protein VHQ87_07280 [Rhizobacter sp.]|jgi:hypothetical protein|nr:hypothetical protein [Rhizobacter sp.]
MKFHSLPWLRGAAFCLLAALGSAQAQVVILQQNFASGLGSFTSAGSVSTGSAGARMTASLLGTDGAITSAPINTQGFSNLTLNFTRSTSGLDSGEAGIAAFSVDGVNYTNLESVQSASGATTVSLPSVAANQSQLRLRFRVNANSALETYTVASLTLQGTTGTTPPPTGGTLPPVSSVDADGPFATTVTQNTGSSRNGWVVFPTNLGANGLKHPLFIWGPGAGTGPAEYEFHLRRLASHGFVVFSETSSNSGSEMTAAITWLIAENSRAASPYYQKLDTTKIAAGGHSRGSVATFAIASDARLTTTLHISGGSFDGNGPNSLRKPAAYICGGSDTLALPNCERDYTNTRVPVFFTTMASVDHIQAAREGLPAITAWLRWQLGGETFRSDNFLATNCAFCTGKWSSKSKNW